MRSLCSTLFLRRICCCAVLFVLLRPAHIAVAQEPPEPSELREPSESSPDFTAADVTAAHTLVQGLGVADWLGPLAPVALSPFFGIACLSGMAIYGESWVSADNAFLGAGSPLNNPVIFWTFLVLTLVTSIPRFTKVSKPFAQAVDSVEAWAGIITLLALKLMTGAAPPEPDEVVMLQGGFGSVTIDALLMIAAVVNILVINTVKFFFEVLIWITPIPTADAAFEIANKTLCGLLMAIYGYSPVLATAINLTMFAIAALMFSWAYRREVFYRIILVDAVWQFFFPPKEVSAGRLIVFPGAAVGDIPARSKCQLCRTESGWELSRRSMLRGKTAVQIPSPGCDMELDAGYFTNSLKITGQQRAELTFSRWFNGSLPELADHLGATLNAEDAAVLKDHAGLRAELT